MADHIKGLGLGLYDIISPEISYEYNHHSTSQFNYNLRALYNYTVDIIIMWIHCRLTRRTSHLLSVRDLLSLITGSLPSPIAPHPRNWRRSPPTQTTLFKLQPLQPLDQPGSHSPHLLLSPVQVPLKSADPRAPPHRYMYLHCVCVCVCVVEWGP